MKCTQCGKSKATITWASMVICRDCALDLTLYLLQELNRKVDHLLSRRESITLQHDEAT
ncbi:MAG: hypothetical protein QXK74_08065 [Candidatus Nitrosocaldaceae archaeon]